MIVPPGQTRAHLAPLPPAALRIDPHVSARLDVLGVRTIGALLRLPRASLPARFGKQLVLRLQQALGEVFEGVTTHEPKEVPHARLEFDQAVHELPLIQPVADQLLADVFEQLRRLDLALRRLDCVLYYEHTSPRTLSIGLSRPSRSSPHVAELLAQRLEQADLSAGVCGLMLVARETSRWRAGQAELFEPREPDEEERLGCLLDRLASRLGENAVLRPQLLDDYQPELAFRYRKKGSESFLCSGAASRKTAMTGSTGPVPFFRPVQLFSRPIPIRVIALVPDGPPTWFAYHGRACVVAAAEGPERLETAWWRGPDVRRDYFRLTAETGEQFWVFHALTERRWYLHGIFA